jgi:hypothetical protein
MMELMKSLKIDLGCTPSIYNLEDNNSIVENSNELRVDELDLGRNNNGSILYDDVRVPKLSNF